MVKSLSDIRPATPVGFKASFGFRISRLRRLRQQAEYQESDMAVFTQLDHNWLLNCGHPRVTLVYAEPAHCKIAAIGSDGQNETRPFKGPGWCRGRDALTGFGPSLATFENISRLRFRKLDD